MDQMKRLFFLISILFGISLLLPAQKFKVITVFQLIENAKFDEAKKAIEESVIEEKTMNWYKTWYARGLLCQTAYREGIKAKDKKKYELYPDQLNVAFDSYEKALSLDKRERFAAQVAPMYVLLANDFQTTGENHFNYKKYEEALKAFENALKIMESPILTVQTDTNLVYNTALAAYECKNWDKAISYLSILHGYNYSVNASHLLFTAYLEKKDTISAEKVLREGIDNYKDNEDLILLLVNLLYNKDDAERILSILDKAISRDTSNYIFPYTKGLIYQKTEQYQKAIETYQEAIMLAPDELKIYTNLSTCYYNSGVEIEENARNITNNRAFQEEKTKSDAAFDTAVTWLEKAHEKDKENQSVAMKLYHLYKALNMTDKLKSLENQDN